MAEIEKRIERAEFWLKHYQEQLEKFPPSTIIGQLYLAAMIEKWRIKRLLAKEDKAAREGVEGNSP